jgi:Predicted nucleotide-binding protein containing TIR-like domain
MFEMSWHSAATVSSPVVHARPVLHVQGCDTVVSKRYIRQRLIEGCYVPRSNHNTNSDEEPTLLVASDEFEAEITQRIAEGQSLLDQQPVAVDSQLAQLRANFETWDEFNGRLLRRRFSTTQVSDEYKLQIYSSGGKNIQDKEANIKNTIAGQVRKLLSISQQIPLFDSRIAGHESAVGEMPERHISQAKGDRVFVGHGRSAAWRELKDFLTARLGLEYEEFNRVSPAGLATIERLENMLGNASMAFLICTSEDEQADGSRHARENVVP